MTDQEIIQGLIDRDNRITYQFLYIKCRPLLTAIMRQVFGTYFEYNDKVSDLYSYLMADDCAKLRKFEYRSTVYQWLKVVATRFFINERKKVIEKPVEFPPYGEIHEGEVIHEVINENTDSVKEDVERMLRLMDNERYADVIRCLVLKDMEPEKYAARIGVTVDNLYNIKKRAMNAFSRIAIKYYAYGR